VAAKLSRYNVASSNCQETTGMFRILKLNLHGIKEMSECSRFYTSIVEILSLRSRSRLKRNFIVYLSLSILLPSL
jgi:hypothetical protein